MNLQEEMRGFGITIKVCLRILLALITCTSNGQKLTSGNLILEKQIDYSLYSGKLAKQMLDRTVCVTSKTDDLVFHLWPQVKLLTLPQYHQTRDSVYYLSLVPMLKRCSQTKLCQYQSTILSFSNLYRMEWTGRRQNWRTEYLHLSLQEESLPLLPVINQKNLPVLIRLLIGKTPVIIHMTVRN